MKNHKTGALPNISKRNIPIRKKITGVSSLIYKGVEYSVLNVDYIADGEVVKQESIYRPKPDQGTYAFSYVTAR
ncbi:hypothetical protein PQC39_gp053 [Vibrio phage Vp_R1]|uniref:Uncharacterized protein n=1 Tax=Vibrio phage Vp_R1 TaxID=2059867 RepID=A0A2H5BQ12_9CAUD|nr:hypothetical protein PQC39_gp053 [Vibrio phage Vp_R1]AUG88417.1 hypothetical protein VPR_053 [Vibrio phage Vp_R1]